MLKIVISKISKIIWKLAIPILCGLVVFFDVRYVEQKQTIANSDREFKDSINRLNARIQTVLFDKDLIQLKLNDISGAIHLRDSIYKKELTTIIKGESAIKKIHAQYETLAIDKNFTTDSVVSFFHDRFASTGEGQ